MKNKLKIAHDYEQLQDQIILTLKDKYILHNGTIEEDDDILQNHEMQNANQARHNVQLKSKLKNVADAASSHLEAKNQGLTQILPHYNDYSYKPQTIEVEEGTLIKPRKFNKKKALGQDYEQKQINTTKLNSEYSTKKSTIAKNNNSELLSFLEETAQDRMMGAKRSLQERDIVEQSINEIKKKRILQNEIKNIVQRSLILDEQSDLLMKSIERSRKKAEKTKQQSHFNLFQAIKEEDEGGQMEERHVEIQLNPLSYKSSESYRRSHHHIEIKEVRNGTSSAVHINLPSERLARAKPIEEETPQSFKQISPEQLQKMREQVSFLQDRQLGTGLAGTLAFLRQNALLGREQQVGRYKDKSLDYNEPEDKIKLQYRNASGKLMKPKQAYRYICAKFHGEGPGKNKVEMRKRRDIEDTRMKEIQNSGGQLMSLLQKHQHASGQAHMVLNVGSKALPK